MKMAFVLFDGMTTLDFVGFYDVITRLRVMRLMEDVSWDLCGVKEEVCDELGVTIRVGLVRPDLSGYDLVFVPGGMGTRALRHDDAFVGWLRTAERVPLRVSVCTGSLLLGAAGFLQGRRATTHPLAYDLLEPYCAEVVRERIVVDGNVITGGGVSTSIDLGLYLLERLLGPEPVPDVMRVMDYPYYETGKYGHRP
ncbi:DJ-1/PfpI family protein [Paenibacillus flagellatus]|uniref:Thiamine biosynthesis protein ThiJ n=1 Tax=Paenibacillus flagellatus TaxID=2211139 RepID=A0A2V5K1M4_9BACL|nr:DJ-1/PfpI family protein [Paenibacillus flagellatus]PYI53011.1 thiamine biosynthesis protein ThiJ [Paenibacillus flagellatus]